MRRTAVLILAALALGGCGSDEVERLKRKAAERVERAIGDVERRIRDIRADAERVGDRLEARVRATLERLDQAIPAAGPGTAPPSADGSSPSAIERYLTRVLRRVDRYWTRTLAAAAQREPTVRYAWIPPGAAGRTACGESADERSALYCPADDTIYIGQTLAVEVRDGVARGFPGQEAGQGRAVGDFGVAYVVAHEYAHNVQVELGFLNARNSGGAAKPFELQADCFAGLWGNSVYQAGQLRPGDVREALDTAQAVGDFDLGAAGHHGTPTERRDAWLLGFESGDPTVCRHFVVA